jgi:DNA polymerase-3 subunit chi
MRVDFYQLSRDPVERVVAMLASKVLASGAKLLVVSEDDKQRGVLAQELWRAPPHEFLANGESDAPGADQQPILLSSSLDAANGATMVMLADGKWRDEAARFDRAFLLFGEADTQAARDTWRQLDGISDVEREIHKQDAQGKWGAGG